MDLDSIATDGGNSSQAKKDEDNTDIRARLRGWADHPSRDPLPRESDDDVCRKILEEASWDISPPTGFSEEPPLVDSPSLNQQALTPRFRVEEKLGEGAFGIVYRVFDFRLKRSAAVKILRPSRGSDHTLMRRFLREGEAMAALHSNNIVQIYDANRASGQPFLVMECVEGTNLQLWLKGQKQPVNLYETVRWLREIASAVSYAHSRGVLHRDLKPSNILLELKPQESGDATISRLVLSDFGLAKQLLEHSSHATELTQARELLGTTHYMSPEQADGDIDAVTTTSDVFSLGIIFYEVLSGKLPFSGEGHGNVIRKLREERPTNLRTLRRDIPRDLQAVVNKCLEKQPKNRYLSAGELVADLDRYLQGQPVEASNPTIVRRLLSSMRTHPYLTFAALFALLCLLITLSLWIALTNRERTQFKRAEANLQLALKGTGRMLFEYAGAINDGRKVSHEDNLQVLLKTLEVHQQLSDQNPGDAFALHRLAVAHYFLANGYARLNQNENSIKHLQLFSDIIGQLLELEPNNPKYVFDGFMSNFRLAGQLAGEDKPGNSIKVEKALSLAEKNIISVVEQYPDNVSYADAYNSLRIFKINVGLSDNIDHELKAIEDSSLSLWRENGKQPLLAKPLIQSKYKQAILACSRGSLEEAKQIISDAHEIQNEVFPKQDRDFGIWLICNQTNFLNATLSFSFHDWSNSDLQAAEAIDDWMQINAHQQITANDLFHLLKLRSAANRMMGLNEQATQYEQQARDVVKQTQIDELTDEYCVWLDAVTKGDMEKATKSFPFRKP